MNNTIFEKAMEKILEENEELIRQNRELQKRNTELVEENRKLRNPKTTTVNIGGDIVEGGYQPTESFDSDKPPRRDKEEQEKIVFRPLSKTNITS